MSSSRSTNALSPALFRSAASDTLLHERRPPLQPQASYHSTRQNLLEAAPLAPNTHNKESQTYCPNIQNVRAPFLRLRKGLSPTSQTQQER
jgi:hypothetical protein